MKAEIKKDFVIQPNAISRSIHSVSTYAKRVITLAISLLKIDELGKPDNPTVEFTVGNFLESFGLEKGRKQHERIDEAIRECMGSFVRIQTEEKFITYSWFQKAEQTLTQDRDAPYGNIAMSFNPELADAIGSFRQQFTRMNLVDIGQLSSKYAIRFYEIAISWIGMKGKDGNDRGEWWFEMSLQEIRERFAIEENKYRATKDFRVRVIDDPIEEINAAGIGLRIEPEYKRSRKRLVSVVFHCREIARNEPRPAQPATEAGRSDEEIKNLYPDEYEKFYKVALREMKEQPPLPGLPKFDTAIIADREAVQKLRDLHPERKTKKRKI